MGMCRYLHPATEIVMFVAMAILLWKEWWFTLLVSVFVISVILIFRVSLKQVYRSTMGTLWIVVMLIAISLFSTHHILSSFLVGYKLLLMIVDLSLLSIVASPFDITYGITTILAPLKYVKFPVSELAFVLSMSLRFIPLMSEEVERIITSQRVRGFDIKNIKHVISMGYSILIPVFLSATQRAEAMAISLYLRGVDVKKGIPPVKEIRFGILDVVVWLICIVLLVVSMYA